MGKRRRMTKAQMRMKYYDMTKRLGVVWSSDSTRMMPHYPFAPPPPYPSSNPYCNANSAPLAPVRTFYATPFYHPPADVNSEDMNGIICDYIPAAITKEEEDDPTSLDNKRLIANSVPSTKLEVALAAELDKKVKHNEHLSAELEELRLVLSRLQAHQSNEPLPQHGLVLHTAQVRRDHGQQKPPQTTKRGPRNGYNMFYAKVAPELKGTLNSYRELAKMISEKWKALSKEEKENYELDAEIFNIMDDRDQSDIFEDGQNQDEERDPQCDSYDGDDEHRHYPPPPPPTGLFDSSFPPPPPGLFDLSFPPPGLFDSYAPGSFLPPPQPCYDNTFLPPPPPNDMLGGGLPPPQPPLDFPEMYRSQSN